MLIKNARFVTSSDRLSAFEGQELPQIALAGKSNVGKSSLINSLARNSKLARTSSEPGKTRLINYYLFNEAFTLVDLPGYGFAKAAKTERDKWGAMIEGYLEHSPSLRRVLLLVDIRREPSQDDIMMANYLRHYRRAFSVIATKADKLSKAARPRAVIPICRALVVQPWEVTLFSAEDDTGRDGLTEKLAEIICS